MVNQATYLQWRVLSSELEALLVEADLINIYQPPFNILLKDDKSPLYLVITKEDWPRVLKFRQRDLNKKPIAGKIFGPFPSAYKLNEVLKIIRPIFPWCNAPRKKIMQRCFEHHLNLCPGVCTQTISQDDYQVIIKQLGLFLKGKTSQVVNQLKQAMRAKSLMENYEQAAIIRDKIKLINEITSETYHLQSDYFLPKLLSDGNQHALVELRQILHTYQNIPREYQLERIEGYDVSNTAGQQAVVSMVVFTDGESDKAQYRSFNIRSLNTPNDYAMLAEAITRRLNHQNDWQAPNLLLIDGGKGQVRAVLQILLASSWNSLPVIGLAKDPDRLIIPTKFTQISAKRLKIQWQILNLPDNHSVLKLLRQIRDEAHRFGKSKHLSRRNKQLLGRN